MENAPMNAQRRKELSAIITELDAISFYAIEDKLSQLSDRIENVMYDEEEAYDNLPDGLKNSAKGEAMADAIRLMQDAVSDIYSTIQEMGGLSASGILEEVIAD
tara:strand:- start:300 stop:611 length:312 start_codon:yes stop_codon:yes gene_type:complete